VRATSRHDDQHHDGASSSRGDRDDYYYDDDSDGSQAGRRATDDARCTLDIVRDDHAAAADDLRGRRCIYSVAAGMARAV
jgi:hypothetical protein